MKWKTENYLSFKLHYKKKKITKQEQKFGRIHGSNTYSFFICQNKYIIKENEREKAGKREPILKELTAFDSAIVACVCHDWDMSNWWT